MKKVLLILVLIISMVSCDSNDSQLKYSYSITDDGMQKREMIAKSPVNDIEIDMVGNATFTPEGKAITAVTLNGYIKYRDKEKELRITNKDGKLVMTVQENNKNISLTSDTGKEIMADAARQIKKLQEKNK